MTDSQFWFTLILGCFLVVSTSQSGEVAIIVNKQNQIDDLSRKELIKIFKSEKQFWDDGAKIYLIMHEVGSPEKAILLERIYKMDNEQLKKFWLGKLYRGIIATLPKTFSSNEAIKRFVSRVPNAIGVVDIELIDDSVKAISIDSKYATDPGYILATHSSH